MKNNILLHTVILIACSILSSYTASAICPAPGGLFADDITARSAMLNWTEVTDAVLYKIAYRKTGSSNWLYRTCVINRWGIYELDPGVNYEYKLQVVCDSTEASAYSSTSTFNTLGLCDTPPVEMYACINDLTSATLNWSEIGGSVTYNVRYREVSTASWTTKTTNKNSLVVRGLTSGSSYEYQAQTVCGSTSSTFTGSLNFTIPSSFGSATEITVDAGSVLNDISTSPVGINMNYLLDDDSYLNPTTSTVDALKNLGVHYLRFPGGEKADGYWWAQPPYTSANHQLARTGEFEWPAYDYNFVEADFTTLKSHTLNFDEFMSICNANGFEPIIVMAYDGMFKAPTPKGTKPNREDLFTSAEEWVKYANMTKGYGIKYWMIGNESYNTNLFSYNGHTTREQYRDDIIELSQRLKAVDPSIKIIVNGEHSLWWETVLGEASQHIDYMGINNFPVWQYTGGYDYYRTNTPDLEKALGQAVNSLYAYAPTADQSRIKIMVTEFNSMDWEGSWESYNDLGHSLVSFEMLGEQMNNSLIEASLFWSTRWVKHDKMTQISSALDNNGNITANGNALRIWGNFHGSEMVYASSTTAIRTFASHDPANKRLYIYAINKELQTMPVNFTLMNYLNDGQGKISRLSGSGPLDQVPVLQEEGVVALTNSQFEISLPPVSVTVIELEPGNVAVQDYYDPLISLYPNPVRKQLHITLKGQYSSEQMEIRLLDLRGRVVLVDKFNDKQNKTTISTSNIKPGIYFLEVTDGRQAFMRKIVVM